MNQNQNQQARLQAAYQLILNELHLKDVPLANEIAKAIHLDWADNTTYDEVSQLTIPQMKELTDDIFAGMGMNNQVAQITDQKIQNIIDAFKLYMRKKENLEVGGRRRGKKSRKTKKSKKTKRTRRH